VTSEAIAIYDASFIAFMIKEEVKLPEASVNILIN
jgi:hypothetical protein